MSSNSTLTDVAPGKTGVSKQVDIIDDHGHVKAGHDPVHVSKSRKEQVMWRATNGKKSTIRFDHGSPFDTNVYGVPAGGTVSSGAIRDDAEVRDYKYTVVGVVAPPNDPIVIIDK